MNKLEQILGISALALSLSSCATVGNIRVNMAKEKYKAIFGTDKVEIMYSETTCRRLTRMGYCSLKNSTLFEMKYDDESYNISSGAGYNYCTDPETDLLNHIEDVGHEVLCNVFVLEDRTSSRRALSEGRQCITGTFYKVTPRGAD